MIPAGPYYSGVLYCCCRRPEEWEGAWKGGLGEGRGEMGGGVEGRWGSRAEWKGRGDFEVGMGGREEGSWRGWEKNENRWRLKSWGEGGKVGEQEEGVQRESR